MYICKSKQITRITMGTADNFLDSFFSAYPQAREGKLDMEELNKLMGEYQHKLNNLPLDDSMD
jgi:hypothetical protein